MAPARLLWTRFAVELWALPSLHGRSRRFNGEGAPWPSRGLDGGGEEDR